MKGWYHVGYGRSCVIGRRYDSVVFGRNDRSMMDGWDSSDSFGRMSIYDGVETVDVVGGVMDGPDSTVGFGQAVGSLDDAIFAVFFLGFVVSGGWIVDTVFEMVRRIRVDFLNIRVDWFCRVCDRCMDYGCFGCRRDCITVDGRRRRVVCRRYA